jgi:hypothetical protein
MRLRLVVVFRTVSTLALSQELDLTLLLPLLRFLLRLRPPCLLRRKRVTRLPAHSLVRLSPSSYLLHLLRNSEERRLSLLLNDLEVSRLILVSTVVPHAGERGENERRGRRRGRSP